MSLPLALALILASGIFCQWLAWRFRLPAIVLLASVGLLLGPLTGWIQPQEDFGGGLSAVIPLFVAVILFEGGLNLEMHELRGAAAVVRRLTSVGVVLAWLAGSLAAHWVGGLSWPVACLLGAILVVTGPTVIIPLLKHANIDRRTASYLKWEGIINDPLGVLLAVLVFQYFVYSGNGVALQSVLGSLAVALGVAIVLGGGLGYALGYSFRRGWVPEYLKAPVIIAWVILINALANLAQHESGLLAVTIMGVVMGNMGLRSIDEMRRFKEYITILLVSFLFVVLTASLDPALFDHVNWRLVMMVGAFLVLVRPVVVWLSTLGTECSWQERAMLGWIAPRGVVAAASAGAFAPGMVEAGYSDAVLIVPAVFMVIFATVVLHGLTLDPLARLLGLRAEGGGRVLVVGASPWSIELSKVLKDLDVDVLVADNDWARLRPARQQGLSSWYGEILSERAEEALELGNIKTVLAVTSNIAYNSLVCNHFATEVGRNQVYQLADVESSESGRKHVAQARRGLSAFSGQPTFGELWSSLIRGWVFQKTRATEEFDCDAVLQRLPENALLIAVVTKAGKVNWVGRDAPKLSAGDTLVSFVPPPAGEIPVAAVG